MKTYLVVYVDWEPIEIKADTFRENGTSTGIYEFLQGETIVAVVHISKTLCIVEKDCLEDG